MELGQIVDYCTEWNRIHESDDSDQDGKTKKKEKVKKRKATQTDWDALFG